MLLCVSYKAGHVVERDSGVVGEAARAGDRHTHRSAERNAALAHGDADHGLVERQHDVKHCRRGAHDDGTGRSVEHLEEAVSGRVCVDAVDLEKAASRTLERLRRRRGRAVEIDWR